MKSFSLLALLTFCCLAAVAGSDAGTLVVDDQTFDSNGVKIRYVTAGEGEAVVLIHGWMGDSSMWGRDASGNTRLTPRTQKAFS